MFKVNNKDTRTTSLTIEQISHLTLMFLLLTLNRKFNCPLEFLSESIKKKKKISATATAISLRYYTFYRFYVTGCKVIIQILQKSQEKTYARVSFLIELQTSGPRFVSLKLCVVFSIFNSV